MNNRVIILHAADGASAVPALEERVAAIADRESVAVELDINPSAAPPSWSPGTFVFAVLTDGLDDEPFRSWITDADRADIPLCPIVRTRDDFDFAAVPASLDALTRRNALGLDEPARIDDALAFYLGLGVPREPRIFVSYLRAEATGLAGSIAARMRADGYRVFLDTDYLVGGEPVQAEIEDAIADCDLVVLLESRRVTASRWVEAEMLFAQRARTPIVRIGLPDGHGFAFVNGPRLDWPAGHDPADPVASRRLRAFVNAQVGRRRVFDRTLEGVLREVGRRTAARMLRGTRDGGRRSWLLQQGRRMVLVQAEPAWPGLESWHKLSLDHLDECPGDEGLGLLVTGAPDLTEPLRAAARWAARDLPLHVCTTRTLFTTLRDLLVEGSAS